MTTLYTVMDSPIGPLLIVGARDALQMVGFPSGKGHVAPRAEWTRDDGALRFATGPLREYFAGERRTFDVPLAPRGTPFQLEVWRELARIPYGTTISYGTLVTRLGNPAASRAVGAANGSNPIPIIVPCHRVIGANGSLTGFGGGIETKRWLLAHEQQRLPGAQASLF